MEIKLQIDGEKLGEDASRTDAVWRSLFTLFPNAIWMRDGQGYLIEV